VFKISNGYENIDRNMFYIHLGVLLCRQWCLVAKKSWTLKLLVKHYAAINQWMKLLNGKSIRLVDCLVWMSAGWGLTQKPKHWNCPDNSHTFQVSHAKQIIVMTTYLCTRSEARISQNSPKCLQPVQVQRLPVQAFISPVNNNNNSNFFCTNILENQAQWRDKTNGLINLIIETNAWVVFFL